MEALANSLPVLLKLAIAALVFALGTGATTEDALYLWRRPGLLLRSLFAMDVVVPVAAVLLLFTLRPERVAALAILAMAVSPGAPIAPQKQLKLGGRLPYVNSLIIAVTVVSILSIPLTLTILHRVLAAEAESLVLPRDVAWIAFTSLLLPLGLGMAVRHFFPRLADRVAKPLSTAVNVFIALVFLLIIIKAFPAIVGLGAGALGAIALITLVSIAGGHLLGGPVPEDRTALAIASSVRHPGLALMIAKVELPGERIVTVILAYILIGTLAAIPYTAWRKRLRKPREEELQATASKAP
jgi:BASS family bile acid:Na+ symporter